jgi:hypothetical protein
MTDAGDTLTFNGATALAARIREYWAKRGHPNVETFVTQASGGKGRDTTFCVRSNLGPNGLPRRLPAEAEGAST